MAIKQKFRVVRGRHIETTVMKDEKGAPMRDAQGAFRDKKIMYGPGCSAGDVFESTTDYAGPQFNGQGMSPKFIRVEAPQPINANELRRRIEEDQRRLQELEAEAKQKPAAEVKPPSPPQNKGEAERAYRKLPEDELRRIAEELEVDVSKCKTKDDLIKTLLA